MTSEAFRLRVATICALAFLPVHIVDSTFHSMTDVWDTVEKPLYVYFEATWIGQRRPQRGGCRRKPYFEPKETGW